MGLFKKMLDTMKYVLTAKTPYIMGGISLSFFSVVFCLLFFNNVTAMIASPFLAAFLFWGRTKRPQREETIGAALGWAFVYILFLLG